MACDIDQFAKPSYHLAYQAQLTIKMEKYHCILHEICNFCPVKLQTSCKNTR